MSSTETYGAELNNSLIENAIPEPVEQPTANPVQLSDQFFAKAYQRGFQQTVRFLLSRGIPRDCAFDTAQGGWTKAWERREQLRNPAFLLTWVNSIALNVYRTTLRREPQTEELLDLQAPVRDLGGDAIDAERILSSCKINDRIVLEGHYVCGYKIEEIARQNNWSETAVRIRLLRARRRARTLFGQPKRSRLLNAESSRPMKEKLAA